MKKTAMLLYVLLLSSMMAFTTGCEESSGLSPEDQSAIDQLNPGTTQKVLLSQAYYDDLKPHVGVCRGNKLCVVICHKPPGNPANSKTLILPLQAMAAHLRHGGDHADEHDHVGPCDDDTGSDDDGSDDGSGDDGSGDDGTTDGGTGDGSGDDGSSDDGTTDGGTGDGSGDDGSSDDGSTGGGTDDGSGDDGTGGGIDEEYPDDGGGTTDPGAGGDDGTVDVDPIPNWCVEFYEFDQNCDGINDNTGMPYF